MVFALAESPACGLSNCSFGTSDGLSDEVSLLQVAQNVASGKQRQLIISAPPTAIPGYSGKGKKIFWSKNSCMTVTYCLDHHFRALLNKANSAEKDEVKASEVPGTGGHPACGSRFNELARHSKVEDKMPGCTAIMMGFMKALRQSLEDLGFDLYCDFNDSELIEENNVGKQYAWGTPKNQASIERQLSILARKVSQADEFRYFEENTGSFCKAELDSAKASQEITHKPQVKALQFDEYLQEVKKQEQEYKQSHDTKKSFRTMVMQHMPGAPDPWIAQRVAPWFAKQFS